MEKLVLEIRKFAPVEKLINMTYIIRIFLILNSSILFAQTLKPQPLPFACTNAGVEVSGIADSAINCRAIDEYVSGVKQLGFSFPISLQNGAMGIYLLTQYVDNQQHKHWYVRICLDDSYKEYVAATYFFYKRELYLVYSADEKGKRLDAGADRYTQLKCLEEIVADRVYIRPPNQKRIAYFGKSTEASKWLSAEADFTGNPYYAAQIIFDSPASYSIIWDR